MLTKNFHQDLDLLQLYRNKKKAYKKLIFSEKNKYFDQLICNSSNKPKQIWNLVNSKLNRKKPVECITIVHKNDRVSNKTDVANAF